MHLIVEQGSCLKLSTVLLVDEDVAVCEAASRQSLEHMLSLKKDEQRALDFSMSWTAWLTSSIGRLMIHGRTFSFAASSSISLMTTGAPIADPPMCTLFMINGKAANDGSGSSGAPTTGWRSRVSDVANTKPEGVRTHE